MSVSIFVTSFRETLICPLVAGPRGAASAAFTGRRHSHDAPLPISPRLTWPTSFLPITKLPIVAILVSHTKTGLKLFVSIPSISAFRRGRLFLLQG